jgi:ketosteroid isomerase-like protein
MSGAAATGAANDSPPAGGKMSPPNVELLAQAFAGWGKDNPANMSDVLHPDCELVVPDSLPYGGTLRGAEAVIGWFTRELWRWFDEFSSTPEGFIDAGDQIVVSVRVCLLGRARPSLRAPDLVRHLPVTTEERVRLLLARRGDLGGGVRRSVRP